MTARLIALRREVWGRLPRSHSDSSNRRLLILVRAALLALALRVVVGADPGLSISPLLLGTLVLLPVLVPLSAGILLIGVAVVVVVVLFFYQRSTLAVSLSSAGKVLSTATRAASLAYRAATLETAAVLGVLLWLVWGGAGLAALSVSGASGLRGRMAEEAVKLAATGPFFGGFRGARIPGVWDKIASVRRSSDGSLRERVWKLSGRVDPATAELHELDGAVLVAYDTALSALLRSPAHPDRPGDPSRPGFSRRLDWYELVVARTWITSTKNALVLVVNPPQAAEAAARLEPGRIRAIIGSIAGWGDASLAKLNLSDDALRTDPKRGNARGIFITLPRSGAQATTPEHGDPVEVAVQRGLRELSLSPSLFRLATPPDAGWDERGVYRRFYRFAGEGSGSTEDYREREATWRKLDQPLRYHAGINTADLVLDYEAESRRYLLAQRIAPPPFPGDQPGDQRTELARFLAEHGPAMRADKRHPLRVVIGLDQRAQPVELDWDDAPHLLTIGATKSGKSFSGVVSPLIQLAYRNSPDDLSIWLVDPKRELALFLDRLPHIRRLIHPQDVSGAMAVMREFAAEAERRRALYRGQDWFPGIGDPALICVIEEFQFLVDSSEAAGDQKGADRFAAQVKAIATTARAVGLHLAVISQKGTSETVPSSLTVNLPTHLVGRVGDAELRLMMPGDTPIEVARVSRSVPGRLALIGPGVVGHEDTPTQVQGLWSWQSGKPAPDIKALIDGIIAHWGSRQAPLDEEEPHTEPRRPNTASRPDTEPADAFDINPRFRHRPPSPDDDLGADLPRPVSQAEVSNMDALTAARIIVRWQSEHGTWLDISRATIHERVRSLGLTSARDATVSAALDGLSKASVLVPASDPHFRRFVGLPWPSVVEHLARARQAEPERDDPSRGSARARGSSDPAQADRAA